MQMLLRKKIQARNNLNVLLCFQLLSVVWRKTKPESSSTRRSCKSSSRDETAREIFGSTAVGLEEETSRRFWFLCTATSSFSEDLYGQQLTELSLQQDQRRLNQLSTDELKVLKNSRMLFDFSIDIPFYLSFGVILFEALSLQRPLSNRRGQFSSRWYQTEWRTERQCEYRQKLCRSQQQQETNSNRTGWEISENGWQQLNTPKIVPQRVTELKINAPKSYRLLWHCRRSSNSHHSTVLRCEYSCIKACSTEQRKLSYDFILSKRYNPLQRRSSKVHCNQVIGFRTGRYCTKKDWLFCSPTNGCHRRDCHMLVDQFGDVNSSQLTAVCNWELHQ